MFHTIGPPLGFLELIQAIAIIACGDILRLVALVLGANRLLAMAKGTKSFCFIDISETFFHFINCSIVL